MLKYLALDGDPSVHAEKEIGIWARNPEPRAREIDPELRIH